MSQYNNNAQPAFELSSSLPENLSWNKQNFPRCNSDVITSNESSRALNLQTATITQSNVPSSSPFLPEDLQKFGVPSACSTPANQKNKLINADPWKNLEFPTMPTPSFFAPGQSNALSTSLCSPQGNARPTNDSHGTVATGVSPLAPFVNPLTANFLPVGQIHCPTSPQIHNNAPDPMPAPKYPAASMVNYVTVNNLPKGNMLNSDFLNEIQLNALVQTIEMDQTNGRYLRVCSPKMSNFTASSGSTNKQSLVAPLTQAQDDQTCMFRELNILREFCNQKFNGRQENENGPCGQDFTQNGRGKDDLEAAKAILSMREISEDQQKPAELISAENTPVNKAEEALNELGPQIIGSALPAVPLNSISPDSEKSGKLCCDAVKLDSKESCACPQGENCNDALCSAEESSTREFNVSKLFSTMSPFLNTALLLASQQSVSQMPSTDVNFLLNNSANINSTQQIPLSIYKCQICKFSSTSKFHYNSHMNTHTDHKCTVCDYTSRTIGRLKRHMNDFHTHNASPSSENACPTVPSVTLGTDGNSPKTELSDQSDGLKSLQTSLEVNLSMQDQCRVPTSSSNSAKPKSYKCKTCNIVMHSKNEYWGHQRSHMKPDRILSCPNCPFVTEYKHHLEYHVRNHFGSKPFKCHKCNYTCVNKSMLNSHMKSHSNFYPYRCVDCRYTTKYCHSLKLHLHKYGHTSVTQLPDDSPEGGGFDDSQMCDDVATSSCAGLNGSMVDPAMCSTSLLVPMATKPLNQSNGGSSSTLNIGSPMPFASLASALRHHSRFSPGSYGTTLPTMLAKYNGEDNPVNLINAEKPLLKCNICFASFESKENLTAHMFAHIVDGKNVGNSPTAAAYSMNIGAALRPSLALKCNFCYQTNFDSKESLANHLVKHLIDNNQLFRRYGLTGAVGGSTLANDPNALASAGSAFVSMLCNPNAHNQSMKESLQGPTEGSGSTDEPDHEQLHDSNSPASTTDKHSGSDEAAVSDPGQQTSVVSKRRKGKAFKLDQISQRLQRCSSASPGVGPSVCQEGPPTMVTSAGNCLNGEIYPDVGVGLSPSPESRLNILDENSTISPALNIDWSKAHVCKHCEMAFADSVMYAIHMGYHGYEHPFKCNMCGVDTYDKLNMFLHVTQAPHF